MSLLVAVCLTATLTPTYAVPLGLLLCHPCLRMLSRSHQWLLRRAMGARTAVCAVWRCPGAISCQCALAYTLWTCFNPGFRPPLQPVWACLTRRSGAMLRATCVPRSHSPYYPAAPLFAAELYSHRHLRQLRLWHLSLERPGIDASCARIAIFYKAFPMLILRFTPTVRHS
jgi:hypothetical protein